MNQDPLQIESTNGKRHSHSESVNETSEASSDKVNESASASQAAPSLTVTISSFQQLPEKSKAPSTSSTSLSLNELDKELLEAAKKGDTKKMQVLLDKGANVCASGRHEMTPLLWAAFTGELEAMKCLINNGAKLCEKNKNGLTALLLASCKGQLAVVQWLVNEMKIPINETNNYGDTALLLAAENGKLEFILWLIAKGADLYITNKNGQTPLDVARAKKHTAIAQFLEPFYQQTVNSSPGIATFKIVEANGAVSPETPQIKVNASTPNSQTAPSLMLTTSSTQQSPTESESLSTVSTTAYSNEPDFEMIEAVKTGDINRIEALLQYRANISDSNAEKFALFVAIVRGNLKVIKWLVNDKNVPLNTPLCKDDKIGKTAALLTSSYYGQLEVLQWLGNEKKIPLDENDKDGNTALLLASSRGRLEVVQWLVSKGASLYITNKNGQTALDVAREYNRTGIIQFLEPLYQQSSYASPAINGVAKPNSQATPSAPIAASHTAKKDPSPPLPSIDTKKNYRAAMLLKPNEVQGSTPAQQPPATVITPSTISSSAFSIRIEHELLAAAQNGDSRTIEKLLLLGANIGAKDSSGNTLLLLAARFGYLNLMIMLVENKGIKLSEANNMGLTALLLAAAMGHLGVIKWLALEKNVPLTEKDKNDSTALLLAAYNGQVEVVQWLAAYGADLNAKNKDGQTALDLARTKKHNAVAQFLEQYDLIKHSETLLQAAEQLTLNQLPEAAMVALPLAFERAYQLNNSRVTASLFKIIRDRTVVNPIAPTELIRDKELGKGGCGQVYKGKYRGQWVAIKELLNEAKSTDKEMNHIREIKFISSFKSRYIISSYGACLEPPYSIVLEFMTRGNLSDLLLKAKPPEWKIRYQIGIDVGEGVRYLHACGVAHKDLKTANILLDENCNAKIADFGVSNQRARTDEVHKTHIVTGVVDAVVGTMNWKAPEVIDQKTEPNLATDIYGYGLILWQLGAREEPFSTIKGKEVKYYNIESSIVKGERPEISSDTPKKMQKQIKMCWDKTPAKRPSAVDVLTKLNEENATLLESGKWPALK